MGMAGARVDKVNKARLPVGRVKEVDGRVGMGGRRRELQLLFGMLRWEMLWQHVVGY
jgi:hypothetical protein